MKPHKGNLKWTGAKRKKRDRGKNQSTAIY